jgi:hypothetical protein
MQPTDHRETARPHGTARRPYHRPAILATAQPEGLDCTALKLTLDPTGPDYMGWLGAWHWAMDLCNPKRGLIRVRPWVLGWNGFDRSPKG